VFTRMDANSLRQVRPRGSAGKERQKVGRKNARKRGDQKGNVEKGEAAKGRSLMALDSRIVDSAGTRRSRKLSRKEEERLKGGYLGKYSKASRKWREKISSVREEVMLEENG